MPDPNTWVRFVEVKDLYQSVGKSLQPLADWEQIWNVMAGIVGGGAGGLLMMKWRWGLRWAY